MSQAIADRIVGSQLAVIAEAAHLSAVEAPETFNALVRDFLTAP
jgi:pimeloyl-ACP methyl ester carboxylesterase